MLGYIRDVPTVSSAEVETALEEIAARNPKARGLEPKQFYDSAPLEKLAREGFIRQLQSRWACLRSLILLLSPVSAEG